MKLNKLSSDHYIIVDDSEIKEGDYCCHLVTKNITQQHNKSCYGDWKKITHSTQPLEYDDENTYTYEKVKFIPLSYIKELLGEVDVEKKARENDSMCEDDWGDGYNQALEDNKDRKYTEEDITEAMLQISEYYIDCIEKGIRIDSKVKAQSIIQSLQPPTQWDVEFVDGKLKLI